VIISVALNVNTNFQIYAQEISQCPKTISTGAVYEDKQGCIQPCPTSNIQGQIPAECPQIPQSQQPDQSIQQQQQPDQLIQQSPVQQQSQQQQLPTLSDQSSQQSPSQNRPLTTTNNINTLGPLDTELKDKNNEKVYPCANDLTGKWIANDGGVYYIKQDGNKMRWFGSTLYNDDSINTAKGFTYSNEAQGNIIRSNTNGTQIYVNWDDVDIISDNHLKGTMTLFVYPSGSKMVTEKGTVTGGFGPSEWTRKC